MDPLSFSASVAGLLSIAIEVTEILTAYGHDVKDAPKDASELNIKVSILCNVLEALVSTLRSDNTQTITIGEQSFLYCVISSCELHVKLIYKNIMKLRDTNTLKALKGRLSWPFQKEECLRSIQTLHQYSQTIGQLLVLSNRGLMLQEFDAVMAKLEEQQKEIILSMRIMRENVPELQVMIQMSDSITTMMSLVSKLSRDSAEDRKKISDGVTVLCARKNDEELKEILQWISPLEPLKRYEDLKSKRFEGTGAWFLKSPKFVTWCHGTASDKGYNPVLACYGIPGSGKSVMSTLVIDTLYALPSTDENRIAVAYFYCDYSHNEKQTAVNMITALLGQVINAHSDHLPVAVIATLKEQRSKGRPTLEESYQFLESALQCFSRFYICIDALDECLDEHRKDFLHLITRLLQRFGSHAARIFTTSRPQMKISIKTPSEFPPCKFELEANEDDIRKYIESKLEKDENFADGQGSDLFKQKIMEKILETASGMFLLPALQIETVLEQTSVRKRRAKLDSMPKKLEDAFQVTIDRIKRQAPGKASQGMEVLKWVYLVKRPLSVMEMRHALATVESAPNAECLDLDDLPFEKSLTECCHGLVVIDNETSTLRLVHKSLQDFLTDQYEASKLFNTGHRDIALVCLRYMSFSDGSTSSTSVCDVDAIKRMIGLGPNYQSSFSEDFSKAASEHIDRFPLLAYAVYFWGHHAKGNIDHEIKQLAVDFLQYQAKPHRISRNLGSVLWFFPRLGWFLHSVKRENQYLVQLSTEFGGVHIIAYFGLHEIYGPLVEKLDHFDINCLILRKTALGLASQHGHCLVVRLLIEDGAQVNCMDKHGRTPLSWAAKNGNDNVVRFLIEKGAQIDPKDQDGRMPLFVGAKRGHKNVVRMLITAGAKVNPEDFHGQTALCYAAAGGHEDVVRLLIERRARVDSTNRVGKTPLSVAAEWGHENVVRLLIEKGAHVESKDKNEQTSLFGAATRGRENIVSLLIEKGAQVNAMDRNGETPLIGAARMRRENVVRLLIEKGALVNSRNRFGKTPLYEAARVGQQNVVRLLIEKGAQVDLKDRDGSTPLSRAANRGHEDIVRLLIEKGAHVDSRNKFGQTPLFEAARRGRNSVVRVLIEKGADVDLKDLDGNTPLSVATKNGHKDVGCVLMERGE